MKEQLHLDSAILYKHYSTCARLHVGASIVNNKTLRQISAGYNGTTAGMPNCCDLFIANDKGFFIDVDVKKKFHIDIDEKKFKLVDDRQFYWTRSVEDWKEVHHRFSNVFEVHAEMNAILSAFKDGTLTPTENMTIYVSTAPCQQCCKLIAATGIKNVVYYESYDRDSVEETKYLLETLGVKLIKAEPNVLSPVNITYTSDVSEVK